MARRADHSREELVQMALSAARALVEESGLVALTARNVAKAIGYSPGTLYNLFEDLDDLVIRLNGRTLDELEGELTRADMTGNPEGDLDQLLELYLGYVGKHPNLWGVLFDYRPASGRPVPDWYLARVARLLGIIENALSPLLSDGDDETRANAARVLWASLHGVCSLSVSEKLEVITDKTAREMAEMLVRCFVSGLRETQAA